MENVILLNSIKPGNALLNSNASKGRICKFCGKWKSWSYFNKKKHGICGFDSRCKTCISKAKSALYRNKKKNVLKIKRISSSFKSKISGTLDSTSIERFSNIFAETIRTLIDDGKL